MNGAFWHGHPSRHKPGRSGAYWDEKIARNVERDRQVNAALESRGWIVVRVWDFEVARELEAVVERIIGALRMRTSDSAAWQCRLAERSGARATRNALLDASHDIVAPEDRSFGENLRDSRHSANLSQADLAERAGASRAAIGAYERGVRTPGLPTIVKLARALGVPPDALLGSLTGFCGIRSSTRACGRR